MHTHIICEQPLLTIEQERELGKKILQGDEAAYHELVWRNTRLVAKLASRYRGNDVDQDELVAAGLEGLCIAARRFDVRRSCKFVTYAFFWVRQAMQRAIARCRRCPSCTIQPHDRPSTNADLARLEIQEEIKSLLGGLSRLERKVLTLRFGLAPGKQPQSKSAVSRKLRLTRHDVRNLEQTALAKLRQRARS